MKRGHFYWGSIKRRDIEHVYLRDIFDKYRKSKKHKMTTPDYPLAYNEWGKVVKSFGERRGIKWIRYHDNLLIDNARGNV